MGIDLNLTLWQVCITWFVRMLDRVGAATFITEYKSKKYVHLACVQASVLQGIFIAALTEAVSDVNSRCNSLSISQNIFYIDRKT